MRMKKLTAWTLTAAMLSSMIPAPVFAAGSNAAETLELVTETVSVSPEFNEYSNDELFAAYAESVLYGYEIATFGNTAYLRLTANEKRAYVALKGLISQVASGQLDSTVFTLGDNEEYKVTDGAVYQSTTKVAFDNQSALDPKKVLSALLSDCPYELYWYDKTVPTNMPFVTRNDGTVVYVEFNFYVASGYAADGQRGTLKTDKTKTAAASAAAANAAGVVAQYKDLTPYERLEAYKEYICEAVSYNQKAVDENYDYGDPWQLIYVFDGNDQTNVVCEGYSKAFQYLCDLDADADSFKCTSPTGFMGTDNGKGGAHMWNVVTLDGASYLVDVTNCDGNSVGAPDLLFLKGAAIDETYQGEEYFEDVKQTIPYQSLYNFQGSGKTVQYYCHDLGIAETNYVATYPVTIDENIQNGSVTTDKSVAGVDETVTLTVTPAEGYQLAALTVTDQDGNNVDLTVVDTTTRTFTMPKGGVTVTADFANYKHQWTKFSATDKDGDHVIELGCDNDDCSTVGTLTLVAPANATYDGSAKEVTVAYSHENMIDPLPTVIYGTSGNTNAGDHTATISVTLGETTKTATLKFAIEKATPEVPAIGTLQATYGDTLKDLTLDAGFAWKDSNDTPVGDKGTHTFTATYTKPDDNTNYKTVDVEVTVEVKARNICETSIVLPADVTYDGKPHSTVTVTFGDYTLKEGTDYKVTYRRDEEKTTDLISAGEIAVVVSGNGNYAGGFTNRFTIAQKEISIAGAAITDLVYNADPNSYTLNVEGVTFSGLVDGESLELGKDYTVEAKLPETFENKAGQTVSATVTVTLSDNSNYVLGTNTTHVDVNIVEHEHNWSFAASGAAITAICSKTGECPTPKVTLTLEAPANLTYDGTAKEVTVKQEPTGVFTDLPDVVYTGDPTINQAINAGAYTATLTYGGKTAALNFKVAKMDISGHENVVDFKEMTYTGEKQTPVAAVTIEGLGTVTGTWSDVTEVGEESTFTPDDKVNFTGTLTADPEMAKANATVTAPTANTLTYNTKDQALVTAGTVEGGELQYSTEENGTYTTTIPEETNAGTYTVWYKVVGDKNHKDVDATSITVKIEPKPVTNPTFVGVDAIYAHTGSAIKPTFTLMDGENVIPDTEYAVAYENNTNVGTATITITDNTDGNYTVSGSTTFEIKEHAHVWNYTAEGADIKGTCVGPIGTCPLKQEQKFTLNAPDALTYDGTPKVAAVEGTIEGVEKPTTITYTGDKVTDNKAVNAGEYIATITLTGNDGKSAIAEVKFIIAPKPVAVTWKNTSLTYNGAAQAPTATASGVNDENVALTVTGSQTDAGTYTATASTKNTNYTLTNTTVDFTIGKAPQDQPTGLKATAETLLGQANGKITGLSSNMQYATTSNGDYTDIDGKKLENLAAGTYYVRYKGTVNYNAGAPAEVTIEAGKPITVTFNANGQEFGTGFAATLTGQSYGLLTKPNPGPTAANSDFAFVGWYKDAACKDAWDFNKDTLTKENVTIYAKWEQKYFEVKVDVKDHKDNAYADAVTIQLMRDNQVICTVSERDEQNLFIFGAHVEAGTYKLVATYDADGTKTMPVTIDAAKTITLNLPAPGVKSELDVVDGAPAVMVDGLDDVAASQKPEGKDITVTMMVEKDNDVEENVKSAIKDAIGDEIEPNIEYLDIRIEQKVGDETEGTTITETPNVIEILIPLDGRYNVKIIRHHNGEAKAFAQNTKKTDGNFYIDAVNGYIHIFAKKFSTYAVSSTDSCTITFNVNGGTGNNSTETTTDGTVTLPADPSRTGYTFKGWYTANGTQVTTETVFTGDTTVYAQWTQNSSGNDYSGGNYYTPSAPTYTVSVPTRVENGSVSITSKNVSKGSTVTLTVAPDKGYELATLIVTDKNGNEITLTDKGNGKFSFTMPASKVDIKATFVEIVAEPEAPVNPFYDVAEGDYFFDAVLWANENGITSGVGNGQFAPHATCTRAQMVTFLWNAAGCPNVSADYGTFTDVTANDYYYKAVLWANANNITSGTGNGAFSPNQICTRAQMATFLYKFAEGQAEGTYNPFVDVTANDYYAQPVQWAVENGITSGTGANTFGPNDPCTRAQMVTFLYRLLAE